MNDGQILLLNSSHTSTVSLLLAGGREELPLHHRFDRALRRTDHSEVAWCTGERLADYETRCPFCSILSRPSLPRPLC